MFFKRMKTTTTTKPTKKKPKTKIKIKDLWLSQVLYEYWGFRNECRHFFIRNFSFVNVKLKKPTTKTTRKTKQINMYFRKKNLVNIKQILLNLRKKSTNSWEEWNAYTLHTYTHNTSFPLTHSQTKTYTKEENKNVIPISVHRC